MFLLIRVCDLPGLTYVLFLVKKTTLENKSPSNHHSGKIKNEFIENSVERAKCKNTRILTLFGKVNNFLFKIHIKTFSSQNFKKF